MTNWLDFSKNEALFNPCRHKDSTRMLSVTRLLVTLATQGKRIILNADILDLNTAALNHPLGKRLLPFSSECASSSLGIFSFFSAADVCSWVSVFASCPGKRLMNVKVVWFLLVFLLIKLFYDSYTNGMQFGGNSEVMSLHLALQD